MLALIVALAAGAPDAGPAPDPLDRVRCVREEVIGSLVQTRKVCHTLREWEVIRRNAHDEAYRFARPEGVPQVAPGG